MSSHFPERAEGRRSPKPSEPGGAQVLGQILRETLRLALVAMAVALPATFGLNLVLAGRLFGLVAVSPLGLLAMAAVLVGVAAVAAYFPARAATRLDPVTALRFE